MHPYTEKLLAEFQLHQNNGNAVKMKQYMKNQFEFLGITAPERGIISKPLFLRQNLPAIEDIPGIVKEIWGQPYRELLYFGIELLTKFAKKFPESWIDLYEWMIVQHAWWDTVDGIAANLVGSYFKEHPQKKESYIEQWLNSKNIWLQRTTIIFQLKYGRNTDVKTLEKSIHYCKGYNDFFLRKAIGWALRQYAKSDPEYVREFVAKNPDLTNLSKKEALKHLT